MSRVMAFPENFEQFGKADLLWMEDNSHDLRVARSSCKRYHISSQWNNNVSPLTLDGRVKLKHVDRPLVAGGSVGH